MADDAPRHGIPDELAALSIAAVLTLATGARRPLGQVPEAAGAELRAAGFLGRRGRLTRTGRRAANTAALWAGSRDGRAVIAATEQRTNEWLTAVAAGTARLT